MAKNNNYTWHFIIVLLILILSVGVYSGYRDRMALEFKVSRLEKALVQLARTNVNLNKEQMEALEEIQKAVVKPKPKPRR